MVTVRVSVTTIVTMTSVFCHDCGLSEKYEMRYKPETIKFKKRYFQMWQIREMYFSRSIKLGNSNKFLNTINCTYYLNDYAHIYLNIYVYMCFYFLNRSMV